MDTRPLKDFPFVPVLSSRQYAELRASAQDSQASRHANQACSPAGTQQWLTQCKVAIHISAYCPAGAQPHSRERMSLETAADYPAPCMCQMCSFSHSGLQHSHLHSAMLKPRDRAVPLGQQASQCVHKRSG